VAATVNPLANTHVTVSRTTRTEPMEPGTSATVAEHVRALFWFPQGAYAAGGLTVNAERLVCDPCDLQPGDVVHDERHDVDYVVESARLRDELPGLDHVEAVVRRQTGVAA
jgi:hypothetical protein